MPVKGEKMEYSVRAAHAHSENNKDELMKDSLCGCFYCLEFFSPTEIKEWIKDTKGTALCPYCFVDSVIGKYTGYPITKEFLAEMHKEWFGDSN